MTQAMESLVDFGFRFDRKDEVHAAQIKVRKRLTAAYASGFTANSKIDRVELYPVSRAGNSGSEVFYCDIWIDTISYPRRHVAKFQGREDTQKEFKAAVQASFAQMCVEPFHHIDDEEDLGLIVYDLAKAPDHIEFRGLFLDCTVPTDFCKSALEKALRDVATRANDKEKRLPIYEDYGRYIHRSSNPVGKLRALASITGEWDSVGLPAADIIRVLGQIEQQTDRLVSPCLVHGDLHARNLVIDLYDPTNIELIDFDWVHYGHPAKDLALMEASLKYMLLSELVQRELRREGSLSFETFRAFEGLLVERGLDLPDEAEFEGIMAPYLLDQPNMLPLLIRTYSCVAQVRASAKVAMARYCANSSLDPLYEYFTGLFLVTVGLFGFQETERFWALAGLQLIALKIEEI
jgi:hypothetical protein